MKRIFIGAIGLLCGFSAVFAQSGAVKKAAATINIDELKGHIRYLSSDLLEGRAPASNGDALAQTYIAAQFEALGLKPGASNGSWLQPFDLVSINTHNPKALTIRGTRASTQIKFSDDYIAVSGVQAARSSIQNAELVFVGYGIIAPEYQWDDYKGMDLKGKVLVFMNNDPAQDAALFAGKTRLYYGRWTYKYEMAAKLGAAGALIIHTKDSAGYPWQVVQSSWAGEQFRLPAENEPTTQWNGWLSEAAAKRLCKTSGLNLDELRASAEKRDFHPVPLHSRITVTTNNDVFRVKTANVIGYLPGSDAKLSKEAVLYTAHHDHLGKKEHAKPGEDAIYNGALDNASGVAGLISIARAYTSLPKAPARSIYFAAVGAEEQGLLGSAYLAKHPTIPAGRIAANINMDGVGIFGPTRDITMVGKGKSSLDPIIERIAKTQGRIVKSDQFPDRGFFYRSDQFNFAKIGVPAAYFDAGTEVIGKPAEWGKEQMEKWEAERYHQPSDEMQESWDLRGAIQDLQLNFYLGNEVAEASRLPYWNKGDEFEAARLQALAEVNK